VTRREKFFAGLDLRRSRGVEIGPLAAPVVSKTESDVLYVDHLDTAALREKYAADPDIDVDRIVPVDAVWGELRLRDCFAGAAPFDYVVASQVIEHVPDMIGWMQEIAEILRPGGRLILAIPDRRYTFDYLRQPTRLNELIDAWLRRNRRPMPAQIFDYAANIVDLDFLTAWQRLPDPGALRRYGDLAFALRKSKEAVREGTYIDVHCWVFTAASLLALLADLAELGLLPFRCLAFWEAEINTNEMTLVLERYAGATPAEKAAARADFAARARRSREAEAAAICAADPNLQSISVLEQQNTLLQRDIAALKERVQALEGTIAALRASRSWRLTRPLRRLRQMIGPPE